MKIYCTQKNSEIKKAKLNFNNFILSLILGNLKLAKKGLILLFVLFSYGITFAQETNCSDNIDNDSDGLIDCQDPDCPNCDGAIICDAPYSYYMPPIHGSRQGAPNSVNLWNT